ncbi:MAG: HDOD domain-containing protein [Planctomycetota bacterium]|nr:HDOD domain-containing protein [Planctomycetota bacterium]
MSGREEIIACARRLEALPAAATEVMRLVSDPETDAATLARAIEHDPGLTANVLRLANSAALGAAARVATVREAVVRLGAKKISRLVMAGAMEMIGRKPVSGYDLPAGGMWRHAIAVALATDGLARSLACEAPGWAFVAGLLHDVGKLVLGTFVQVDAEHLWQVSEARQLAFDEAEREVLGIDHAELGALLLAHWGLPEEIVAAVRWHHRPEGQETHPAATWVHCADALCLSEGLGLGNDGLRYRLSGKSLLPLGVKREVADRVLCLVVDGLREMKGLFLA